MISSFILVLLLSVILLFVHIFAQGMLATRDFGLKWNVGARDGDSRPRSLVAQRAARASANYRETYPAFLVLCSLSFMAHQTGVSTGAWVWLAARLLYLPAYLSGIPYLRSVFWLVAFAGLGWMAFEALLVLFATSMVSL